MFICIKESKSVHAVSRSSLCCFPVSPSGQTGQGNVFTWKTGYNKNQVLFEVLIGKSIMFDSSVWSAQVFFFKSA